MEVHRSPDEQAKLEQIARDVGRKPAEVIADEVVGLFDELAPIRGRRSTGGTTKWKAAAVSGIDVGEEAYRRLLEKTVAWRVYAAMRHERVDPPPERL